MLSIVLYDCIKPNYIYSINNNNKLFRTLYAFLNGKYYFDVLYNQFLVQNGLNLGYNISKEIDKGAIELLGPYGISISLFNTGNKLSKLDTGIITTYALYITLALLTLLFLVFAPILINETTAAGNFINIMETEIRLFIVYTITILFIFRLRPSEGQEIRI